MAITQILDHAARAAARLIQRFKGKARVTGLLAALANEVQLVENGLYGLFSTRDLENATAATLDGIGALVGAPVRGPMNDTDYRKRVKVQIIANRGSGTFAEIYALAKLMVAGWDGTGGHDPRIFELGFDPVAITGRVPLAGYVIKDGGGVPPGLATPADLSAFAQLLKDVNPAGVRGIVLQSNELPFGFSGDGGLLGFNLGRFTQAYEGR